jgi:PAS domain S-box-containing protein
MERGGAVLLVELDTRATALLLGGWRGSALAGTTVWAGSASAALDLVAASPGTAEVVVVADLAGPLDFAQRLQSLDPELGIVLLTTAARHGSLMRAVAVTPLLGRGVVLHPFVDDTGALTQVIAAAISATRARRERARVQRASGEHAAGDGPSALRDLGQLLDAAPVGVVKTCERGRVLGLNKRACEVLETTERVAIGAAIDRLIPSIGRTRIEETAARRAPCVVDRRRKDGRGQALELTVSRQAGAGAGVGFLLLLQDVTERVTAERSLRLLADASARLDPTLELEELLAVVTRIVVPTLADSCVIELLDEEARCAQRIVAHDDPSLAEAAAKLEVALHADRTPLCDAPRPPFIATVDELAEVAKGPDRRALLRLLEPESIAVVPLLARGRALGILTCVGGLNRPAYGPSDLALLEDLGRRAGSKLESARLHDELVRADRAKDDLMAMLAHELRNPLAAIFTAAQLLRLPRNSPERIDRARDVIDRQGRHLVRIVDDLLDVSRFARGSVRIEREPLDLATIAREVVNDFRGVATSNGVELVDVIPRGPLPMQGDRTRLAQVMGNLLSNAVKFTDRGGRVTLELAALAGRAVLTVRDTGIGLDANTLRTAFQPFVQADRSLDRSRGGLGLGLAIVSDIVRLHGGAVEATSEGTGRGSTFTVSLPIEPDRQPARPSRTTLSTDLPGLRLLIVEDNTDAADTLRELLEHLGHQVVVAASGPEALTMAAATHPEVILCDLGLPGMDGFEVARRLRKEPATADVRLVALSGYGRDVDRQRAAEAGFDEHITKPLQPEVLETLLRGAAERREASRNPS